MASFTQIKANNKQGYMWICIKDGPPDPVTGKRNQIKRRGTTKKEAEARADKAINSLKDDGIDTKKIKHLPFEKVAQEWLLAYSRTGVKKGTIRLRKNSIATLNEHIGQVNIDKVTHKAHQNILNKLFDEGYSKSTIEGVHVTANLIYKHAIKEKYIKDNPATGAIIPIKRRTVEEIENSPIEEKYLERHELEDFLGAVRLHGLEDDLEIFYLIAFTGIRSGELCALKETDFDFESLKMRITKTIYNPNNNMSEYELVPPKTVGSIRTIELDENIMMMIKALIKRRAKLRMVAKHFDPDYHDKKFIFCNDKGYPFVQKFVQTRMERVLRKTEIRKKATPHIFRHTHVSMLAEAGVDLPTIMQRVGHDDSKTTIKIYMHITDKMKEKATDQVNAHFSDLLKKAVLQGM
ncbi:tyrosine-type recombinase/integrase [Paenibacillus sepulcri]|uniref:Site-specific integrase n=1 Tax=Paenibacillus sepulcri TaxID=359917 RepID=A0ABS7BYZ2_9BACL|nr:site-specific integrase [Paenibacillus sepulcri]